MRKFFLLVLVCSLSMFAMESSETDPLLNRKARKIERYRKILQGYLYKGWNKRRLKSYVERPYEFGMSLQELQAIKVEDNGYNNGESSSCCTYNKERKFKKGEKGILACAFRRGDKKFVRYLLSQGCNPNTQFRGTERRQVIGVLTGRIGGWENREVVVGCPLKSALKKRWFDVAVDLINGGAHVKDAVIKEAFPDLKFWPILDCLAKFTGKKLNVLAQLILSKDSSVATYIPSIPSLKTKREKEDCYHFQNILVYLVIKRANMQPFFEHDANPFLVSQGEGSLKQTPLHFFAIASDENQRKARKHIHYLFEQIRFFNRALHENGSDYDARSIDIEQLKAAKDKFGHTAYEYFEWNVIKPKLELVASAPPQEETKTNTTIQ